jgi:hypothetical protein
VCVGKVQPRWEQRGRAARGPADHGIDSRREASGPHARACGRRHKPPRSPRPAPLPRSRRVQAMGAAGKLAYTIVRPGGLQSEAATGKAVLTEDAGASGMITREDVASLVVKALFSHKADGKVRRAPFSQLVGCWAPAVHAGESQPAALCSRGGCMRGASRGRPRRAAQASWLLPGDTAGERAACAVARRIPRCVAAVCAGAHRHRSLQDARRARARALRALMRLGWRGAGLGKGVAAAWLLGTPCCKLRARGS